MRQKWPELPFRGNIWFEIGHIIRLEAISAPKVAGFIV